MLYCNYISIKHVYTVFIKPDVSFTSLKVMEISSLLSESVRLDF